MNPDSTRVAEIVPSHVAVGVDPILIGLQIEFVDPHGRRFQASLDQAACVDLVLQVVGALARLRGEADSGGRPS